MGLVGGALHRFFGGVIVAGSLALGSRQKQSGPFLVPGSAVVPWRQIKPQPVVAADVGHEPANAAELFR